MPNQYTKFNAAGKDPASRAFTFREWSGKKQKRGKITRKKDAISVSSSNSSSTQSSGSDSSSTRPSSVNGRSVSPSDSLLYYRPSGGLRIDPFDAYPVVPDHSQLLVLDHYFHVLLPSGKQNELVLKPTTRHVDPHVNLLFPYVMHHTFLFDAMIASCQASMALSSGLSAYNDLFFIAHRGRALAGLRQKLKEKPDTSAILCITLLITCDYLLGDIKAVALHTNTLQRLVEFYGVLPEETVWDRFVKHGVEAYKYVGSLATGLSPDDVDDDLLQSQVDPSKDLEYPDRTLAPIVIQQLGQVPAGFVDLIMASQISTQLCAIIRTFSTPLEEHPDSPIRSLRSLLPIQAALQRFAQHNQASYLERCVAAGLLAYSFQSPRIQVPNMFHDPPLQGIIRLFSVTHRPRSEDERALLMWAMVVAQTFMSTRGSPLPESREVFARFVKREPSMRIWAKVERSIRRFFWSPSLLERWKGSHERLLARADALMSDSGFDSINNVIEELEQPTSVCPVSGKVADGQADRAGRCPFSLSPPR